MQHQWDVADLTGFSASAYDVVATSPGSWAEGGQVTIWYRFDSLNGPPEVDVRVAIAGESVEAFTRIPAGQVAEQLAAASRLIQLVPAGPALSPAVPPRRYSVSELVLTGGTDAAPDVNDYLAAVDALADQPEVAIVAAPDLGGHLTDDGLRQDVVSALLSTAAEPAGPARPARRPRRPGGPPPADALAWATTMLPADSVQRRAAAVYYPGLLVPDPLGGLIAPLRAIPPSGHVAGVISQLDRDRGAYYTPANVVLEEAVDLDPPLTEPEQEVGFHGRAQPAALRAGAWPAGLGRAHAGSRPPLRRAPAPAAPAGPRRAPGRRSPRLRRQRT